MIKKNKLSLTCKNEHSLIKIKLKLKIAVSKLVSIYYLYY